MRNIDGMTSRERVHATVKGLPVDRIPVWYYLNPHAACKLIATDYPTKNRVQGFIAKKLWKYFLNKPFFLSDDKHRGYPLLMTFFANADYAVEMGSDIALVSSYTKNYFYRNPRYVDGRLYCNDIFGGVRTLGNGIYLDVYEYPIKSIDDATRYVFPDPDKDHDYSIISKFRKQYPDVCIMSDANGAQDAMANWFWGMTFFLTSLIEYPEVVKDFQNRWIDYQIGIIRRSIAAGADMILIYDDYGYTNRTFLSNEMWKEFSYPHLKRIIDVIHELGAVAMLHSCGYQMTLLDYYAEAGLDVLQGLQPLAGNDFQDAYARYSDRFSFTTGIDTQGGEFLNATELREEILRSCAISGKRGKHILGMTHMLQYTMPDENMRAIFNTVRELQHGMIVGDEAGGIRANQTV
ncbi:MAG: hypothetical protein JXA20_01005 [Spirochaetes bacterium]|nr:hypothetical protein [Spirochaetota bacterium]